jgi:hypothetical protein
MLLLAMPSPQHQHQHQQQGTTSTSRTVHQQQLFNPNPKLHQASEFQLA